MLIRLNHGIFGNMSYQERSSRQEGVVVRGAIGLGKELLDQPRSLNAFFGISLDKPISNRHLRKYVQWILDHCRHCPVLIDDIEFRHNWIVFDRMDEKPATDLALSRGLGLAARVAGIVAEATYPYKEETDPEDHRRHGIWVNRSSELFRNDVVSNILESLAQAYKEDEEFRQGVDAQVEKSMGNRIALWRAGVSEEEYKLGRAQLAKFVLEETAVTVDYVERGYTIELYTGAPIQVVVDLYNPQTNKYPKLREALNVQGQYGHISLGIEQTPQKQTSLGG